MWIDLRMRNFGKKIWKIQRESFKCFVKYLKLERGEIQIMIFSASSFFSPMLSNIWIRSRDLRVPRAKPVTQAQSSKSETVARYELNFESKEIDSPQMKKPIQRSHTLLGGRIPRVFKRPGGIRSTILFVWPFFFDLSYTRTVLIPKSVLIRPGFVTIAHLEIRWYR